MSAHKNVLVIGGGLIGTSIALDLMATGRNVFVRDIDATAQEVAVTRSGALAFAGQEVDVVIVATPPSIVANVIRSVVSEFPNAVVTDVASVKGSIASALADLPEQAKARIVGGHPMAGREVSGAVGAQAHLFQDRPWVLTRLPETSDSAIAAIREIATDLGAVPIERSVDEHDRAVALVSHTPQVIASLLSGLLVDAAPSDVELAGQGLRDTIRIASSDADLWTDILLGNAQAVGANLSTLAHELQATAEALNAGNQSAIYDVLAQGSKGRARLPGKHGASAQETTVVVVRLEDKPGELARLFTAAAEAQVNLEDVRIDHALGRMTGLVELTVATDSSAKLVSALEATGFTVFA
ncbi:MAG: prephenate dehydrogenase [Actinobacteria bacterium]|nr:prephenate dehydrogenase [Actinomycetota bacterium]